MSDTDLLSPTEAQELLGIGYTTLNRLVSQGRLPAIRITEKGWRRFRRADVLALLEPGDAA